MSTVGRKERALRAKAQLWERSVADFGLIPERLGQLYIAFDGKFVFARHEVKRFPMEEEVAALV